MSTYHLLDNDKKKNQFSREERLHLLGIMCQYAPLLDNKNASIVGRKEIWETIERQFNEAGFIGKTSAQLKKYWQNYKYHNKRMKALRKENDGKRTSPLTKLGTSSPTSGLGTEEWEGRVRSKVMEVVENRDDAVRKSRGEIYEENGPSFRKLSVSTTPIASPDSKTEARLRVVEVERSNFVATRRESPVVEKKPSDVDRDLVNGSVETQWGDRKISAKEIGDRSKSSTAMDDKPRNPMSTGLVVSNADISDNSVTVSIICPEGSISSRNVLAPRKAEEKPLADVRPEKLVARCQSSRNPDRSDSTAGRTSDGDENCGTKEKAACPRPDRFVDYATNGKSESNLQTVKDTSNVVKNKALCFLLPKRRAEKDAVANESTAASSRTKSGNGSVVKPETSTGPTHRGAIKVKDVTVLSGGNRLSSNAIFKESHGRESLLHDAHDETDSETSANNRRDESSNPRKRRREDGSMGAGNAMLGSDELERGRRGAEANSWNELRRSDDDYDDCFPSEFQELNHQLILRQLETEEKRLKVKIAEMSVQEVQFRIRALNEDMKRAEELHELRLALTAGGKANIV